MGRQPRYSNEDIARRRPAIYEQRVTPQMKEGNSGKIVSIDVETGELEIGDDTLTDSKRLLAHYPDAQTWLVRIEHRAAHRIGALISSALIQEGAPSWQRTRQ